MLLWKKLCVREKKTKQNFFPSCVGKNPVLLSYVLFSYESPLLLAQNTSGQQMCFSHTKQFSTIPPEYPVILVSSDTFYLKKEWQSQAQGINCASEQKTVDRRFPNQDKTKQNKTLGSINSLEWLTELGEIFHLFSPVYYKRLW